MNGSRKTTFSRSILRSRAKKQRRRRNRIRRRLRGSPRAVEISAMDFSVRLGKPDIHRDIAVSDRPILRARSFCVISASGPSNGSGGCSPMGSGCRCGLTLDRVLRGRCRIPFFEAKVPILGGIQCGKWTGLRFNCQKHFLYL